jgi:hypothetical protein
LCWVFLDRVSQTVSWLQTLILLMFASCVARMTDMSHWHELAWGSHSHRRKKLESQTLGMVGLSS